MAYRTTAKPKKTPKKKAAPVVAAELTATDRLAAAQRAGNPSLVQRLRTELGLSSPPVYRDALHRVSKGQR